MRIAASVRQACRLPYELICDGRDVDLGDQKYLLSPQDLAAYALIPELIEAGASAFKIEGRLKTPEYVANITRHYRRGDRRGHGRAAGRVHAAAGGGDGAVVLPRFLRRLAARLRSQSAGAGPEFGQTGRAGRHRCAMSARDDVRVDLQRRLKAGDGLVFEGDRAAGEEQGGRVFSLHARRASGCRGSDVGTGGDSHFTIMRWICASVGRAKVWKSDDPGADTPTAQDLCRASSEAVTCAGADRGRRGGRGNRCA